MTEADTIKPDHALGHLEARICEAWLTIRPDRRKEAKGLRSATGEPITVAIAGLSGGEPFACNPSFGNVTMKWWSLEVLWIAAYAFHYLGGPLARAALDGQREIEIEKSPRLTRARNLLAHGARVI